METEMKRVAHELVRGELTPMRQATAIMKWARNHNVNVGRALKAHADARHTLKVERRQARQDRIDAAAQETQPKAKAKTRR